MKRLMIAICTYLEAKYTQEIKAIITHKETKQHFEIDVE